MFELVAILALACLSTWGAVAAVRRVTTRLGMLAHPNERSAHAIPMPTMGGIGIVLGIWCAVATARLVGIEVGDDAISLFIVASAMGGLGLADDLYDLGALPKLALQVVAALGLVAATAPVESLLGFELGPLSVPFSVLWIVAVTNFYNFMDGIDGLAGGMTVIGGLAMALGLLWSGAPELAIACALVACTGLGFLRHNFPPASIFMGNVGASFLGFFFAGTASVAAASHTMPLEFFALVLAPFLFDTSVTLIRRIITGERWWEAHRSHYYQRLLEVGWSLRRIDAAEYFMAVVFGGAALVYLRGDLFVRSIVLVSGLSLLVVFAAAVNALQRRASAGDSTP